MGGDINRPRVVWDENVVDNEFLGRKKSKSKFTFLCIRETNADLYDTLPQSAASTTNQKHSANHPPIHRHLPLPRIPIRIVPLPGQVIQQMIG